MNGLTVKQTLFVDAYVGPAAGNASIAAKMAGYTGGSSMRGHELKYHPLIQEAIGHALARKKMTPEWAKDVLADMVRASMTNFLKVDKDGGGATLDFKQAAKYGALGQIKEYNVDEKGRVKLKLHDRVAALQLLLKFYNLINDRPDSGDIKETARLALEEYAKNGLVSPPIGTTPTE